MVFLYIFYPLFKVLGGSCAKKSKRLYDWTLDIPDLNRKPPTLPPIWPKTSNRTHKILHLSDPHVQLDYAVSIFWECFSSKVHFLKKILKNSKNLP